jgi:hypothetical protein
MYVGIMLFGIILDTSMSYRWLAAKINQPYYKHNQTHSSQTDLPRSSTCLTLREDFWGYPANSNTYMYVPVTPEIAHAEEY